jgi:hypothetical protein
MRIASSCRFPAKVQKIKKNSRLVQSHVPAPGESGTCTKRQRGIHPLTFVPGYRIPYEEPGGISGSPFSAPFGIRDLAALFHAGIFPDCLLF